MYHSLGGVYHILPMLIPSPCLHNKSYNQQNTNHDHEKKVKQLLGGQKVDDRIEAAYKKGEFRHLVPETLVS